MKFRHWVMFIVLNIVISAATAWTLLSYWERTHPARLCEPTLQPVALVTPGVTPSATRPPPTATLLPSSTIYIVQRGDTLLAISRRFNVPLADLLAANQLTVDSILQVGQTIRIPTGASPLLTPTASPAPSLTSPSSELVPPTTPTLIEIRQVIARGDPTREAVVIANLGRQVNLRGWRLLDNEGYVYTFPDLTLWPGGTITVHTGSGPDSVSELYWKRIAPMWAEPGDVVTLTDADGNVVARYQLP